MASFLYNSALEDALKADIDYAVDAFKVMLVTATYVPSNAHNFRSDVTNESSGTGYTAGGAAVTCTVSRDDANNRVDVTFDPVAFAAVSLTARAAVIYKNVGTAGTDRLVAYVDFGANKSPVSTTLNVSFTSPLRIQK